MSSTTIGPTAARSGRGPNPQRKRAGGPPVESATLLGAVRRLAGADVAALVTPVPGGLRVEASDPPSLALPVGGLVPVPIAMVPAMGLLAGGHLRWARLPPAPGLAHAALFTGDRQEGMRHLFLVATFDRRQLRRQRGCGTVTALWEPRVTGAGS